MVKCKRVIRSVLTFELYVMTNEFDVEAVFKSIIKKVLEISVLSLVLCTNSKSFYDCFVRLKNIQKKRLMIDIMCLRQFYEKRKITKIKWIDENSNLIDAMIKVKSCEILKHLIDTNTISFQKTK